MGCKKHKQSTHDFEEAMCDLFPPEWVRETAKEKGAVKRKLKIGPVAIFWVLTLSFGVGMQRTLVSIKRSYEWEKELALSNSWYERFSPEFVYLLKACVIH